MKQVMFEIVIPSLVFLVGLAVIVTASVIFYNWWDDTSYDRQERRERKRTNRAWLETLSNYEFAKVISLMMGEWLKNGEHSRRIFPIKIWLEEKHEK